MDLQFRETTCPWLQQVKREVQNQEQTQEVRLPDGMPDVGRVLAAWGQVLMRGKEWRSDGMKISGGVMAWVLYKPEDGGDPQCVETWIPFQMKWDLPETQRDGTIRGICLLRGVDARSISARKIMVRTNVGVLAEALVQTDTPVACPEEIPEDVQMLRKTYPVRLPREAGEKPFEIEEEMLSSDTESKVAQILRCSLHPEIQESRVMAGRVVFRGTAHLYMLCRGENGHIFHKEHGFPFSQFADLEREYGPEAAAKITPVVTGLETEIGEEGQLRMKCGLTGQYVIQDTQMLELVEDAYSLRRNALPSVETLDLPALLESQIQTVYAEQTVQMSGVQIVDTVYYPDHAWIDRQPEQADVEISGVYQMLSYDQEGNLQSETVRAEAGVQLQADENSRLIAELLYAGKPTVVSDDASVTMRCEMTVEVATTGRRGFSMVTALELGEEIEPDPDRPSLIIRRAEQDSLWDLAKSCKTTVDAICSANGLNGEPESTRMLLIPVP